MTDLYDSSKRPTGSNADEWQLFLVEYFQSRPSSEWNFAFMAAQIAQAIDEAQKREREKLVKSFMDDPTHEAIINAISDEHIPHGSL